MSPAEIRYIRKRDHNMKFSKSSDSSAIFIVLFIFAIGYLIKDSDIGKSISGSGTMQIRKERFEDELNTILIDYLEN